MDCATSLVLTSGSTGESDRHHSPFRWQNSCPTWTNGPTAREAGPEPGPALARGE